MYAKYQTDALVLGSRNVGESDKLLTLYTCDFGLVRARASALRSEKSKMRYALQNFSRSQTALVRGLRGWRVAGALPRGSVREMGFDAMRSFARIAHLMTRLTGEEKNEYLFETLAEARRALARAESGALPMIELMCVARILYALGYISKEALELTAPRELALFTHTTYTGEFLKDAEALREKLLGSVNRAIAETHL